MKKILKQIQSTKISYELRRGLEKESLRVTPDGHISERPHFEKLGSALTHPFITTDYSEALLEFVTPVFNNPREMLDFLKDLHLFTLKQIGDEVLWANSMPCLLKKEETIPLAYYGSSNIGTMKTLYRKGLKSRYGSGMQVISGIHFNFSLTDSFFKDLQAVKESSTKMSSLRDFKSSRYMNATRNIHKFSWLIPFIFGASPAICRSFLNKAPNSFGLKEFDKHGTLSFDGATSLRQSNLGYTNSKQDNIEVCYNNVESYAKGLRHAISTNEPDYESINLANNGELGQLNSNILQLENEYYSSVRPKRVTLIGESPTTALLNRGVEYIELRSVDINPFSPIGIDLEQVLFLDVFLIYCLLKDHDGTCNVRNKSFRENQEKVARHGRLKGLTLFNGKIEISAKEWAKESFEEFLIIAQKLDSELGSNEYTRAIQNFSNSIEDTSLLYSEKILTEMKDSGDCFFSSTLKRSQEISKFLKSEPLSQEKEVRFKEQAILSLLKQKEIENSDKLEFPTFLKQYFELSK